MGELIKPLTPHDIYEKLRAGGTGLLEEGRRAAQAQAVTEGARSMLIARQAALLQTGWEGSAGDGASGVVKSLVDNAQVGTDQLLDAQNLMDQQSGSFHHAANSVRPVPAEPPKFEVTDMMFPLVDFEKQITAYQDDAQHNIDVFRGYDTASESHESGMKSYTIVDDSGGTVRVGDTGDYIEIPDDGQPRDQLGPFVGRRDPGSGPGGGPGSWPGDGPGGPPVGGAAFEQPQQTSPSNFVPRPPFADGQPVPGQTPARPTPFASGLPVGGFTGGPGPGGTGGPGARGRSYGGPGTDATGRGPAMRGGMLGAGALAAEEAAAQRAAAGAAGRGGSGLAGGTPVGNRSKGDEDEKHQRKILIEADTESLFGSDELTAPQVIGDDEYEDD